ncbi:MAG: carboxypeptidase-like regulatory domain-containing protein [Chloroflexota bacterium]|nr:carboxypeptidase-like regulatory domain-containing protein [Chloroflexota bacterium]
MNFAALTEVDATVVDVGTDARVAVANTQADQYKGCPYAKNVVANEIKRVVDSLRQPATRYVVLVGSDAVIPFFRYPDRAPFGNERQYVPPVLDSSASQASLRLGYVLSQDLYGTGLEVSQLDHSFPIFDLAVGRIGETAAEATGLLTAYPAATHGVVPLTTAPLVTGYDFMADGARAIARELTPGTGQTTVELVHDFGSAAPKWTADELRAAWLGQRHDIAFIAAHFSESAALAADGETTILSSELEGSPTNLTNTIVFGQGCHLAYNLIDADGVPLVTHTTDWVQAAARKRVGALIAGTGYQFGAGAEPGETGDIIYWGERLYLEYAKALRTGAVGSSVTVGEALVAAKKAYLASVGATLGALEEKQVLESTLFGLPMLAVVMPGKSNPGSEPAIATLPLDGYADVTITSTLTLRTGFYDGGDGNTGDPGTPILPLEIRNVAAPDTVLRGVGFRGGSYADQTGFRPTITSPTTETTSSLAGTFQANVFFPVRLASVNYYETLATGATRLYVTPAQFRSGTPDPSIGTLRKYSATSFRLFSSTLLNATGPHTLHDVSATPSASGTDVTFVAYVDGDPALAVQQLWVTYTTVPGNEWRSTYLVGAVPTDLALAQEAPLTNPSRWSRTVSLASLGVANAEDLRFIVQVANAAGLVSAATNGGQYYTPAPITVTPSTPKQPTTLVITSGGAGSDSYGKDRTFTATLSDAGGSVVGARVSFTLGGQRMSALTDADGRANVTMPLLQPAGSYPLIAGFREDASHLGISVTSSFVINRRTTDIKLSNASLTLPGNGSATLRADNATGRPIEGETVFFVATALGRSFVAASATNASGVATIAGFVLPVGTYTLTASFGSSVSLPNGGTYNATSNRYVGSTVSGTLSVIANATPTYTGDSLAPVFTPINLGASVAVGAGTSAAGLPYSQVRYVVQKDGVTVYETTAVQGPGNWPARIQGGLPTGVYAIQTSVIGREFAGNGQTAYLAVYDTSGGFVTGAGWIQSPPGAYYADRTLVGKATFGFVAKYAKGSTDVAGNTEFHFQAAALKFKSSTYDTAKLVIADKKAQYKGTGTIDGRAGTFNFMVTAIDGQVSGADGIDRFRIRIWNAAGVIYDNLIYDNLIGAAEDADPTTALGGGNIVIHKP